MRMMTTISTLLAAARRAMPPSSFFERASWTLAPPSLPRMPSRGVDTPCTKAVACGLRCCAACSPVACALDGPFLRIEVHHNVRTNLLCLHCARHTHVVASAEAAHAGREHEAVQTCNLARRFQLVGAALQPRGRREQSRVLRLRLATVCLSEAEREA